MGQDEGSFLEAQRAFFAEADKAHFRWQTENATIAASERELLRGFPIEMGAVLEVGCGEGGNLKNLIGARSALRVVGLDLFERKVAFAKANVVGPRFVCGDALALPFADGSFDALLCRDVLHHLAARERALRELRRVAKPGAEIWILEPNGTNPLMRLLAMVRPHERGLLRNSVSSLCDLTRGQFPNVRADVRQPLPLSRMLLHYEFGMARLGRSNAVGSFFRVWDRLMGRVMPRRWWAYVLLQVKI